MLLEWHDTEEGLGMQNPAESFPRLTLAELADPSRAVQAAIEVYGLDAATAVAHCALTAHFDGRRSDCRFWCQVFRELGGKPN
jgi:hypothetical protein